MNALLTELDRRGCDVKGAFERFIDDEEFYASCYKDALADEAFEKLGDELNAGNVQAAFDYAHTLKGVISNMGLTPMYDLIVEIVEPLRVGDSSNLETSYKKLLEMRNDYQKLA